MPVLDIPTPVRWCAAAHPRLRSAGPRAVRQLQRGANEVHRQAPQGEADRGMRWPDRCHVRSLQLGPVIARVFDLL